MFQRSLNAPKIDLPAGSNRREILKMCRECCRSDHFVLIDEYKDINDTFMLGAAMSGGGQHGLDQRLSNLFRKQPA
jgi:hypothetical protein